MANKIILGLTAFMLAACAILWIAGPAGHAAGTDAPATAGEQPPAAPPEAPEPPETPPPEEQEPEPSKAEAPDRPEPVREPQEYVFGEALEGSDTAEDEFFDTAVFLGDSRTEGLQIFGGLDHGDFYWSRGMSVFRADDERYAIFDVNGEKVTLLGALRAQAYESVYIMLGINELGYTGASYEKGLADLLDAVLEAQPDAVVYLQTLPPINDSVAKDNSLAEYERNANVTKFNKVIVKLAEEKKVVLLDTASVYRGSDGQLPSFLTSDGVHFTSDGYTLWADYLRDHTMDPERYFYNREAASK